MRLRDDLRRRVLAESGLPIVWLLLTIVALVPVWHQRLLPMLETPHDLALVRGWHSFHDPLFKIADYYTLHVRPFPPILFYAVVHALTYVVSIEVANKLFLSAYLVLFPLSVLALARALGRSPWLALGSFAVQFNQNWIYGLSSLLMGTALMMFAVAALIRWLNQGRRWQVAWLAVSTLLCYFADLEVWFCLLVCAVALMVRYHRQWRNALFAGLAMAPSAIFAIAEWRAARTLRDLYRAGKGLAGLGATWHDFPTLVMNFPRRLLELFPGDVDKRLFWLLAFTVVALAAWRRTRLTDQAQPQRGQLHMLVFMLVAIYLLVPYELAKPTPWYLAPRIPALVAPLLLLLPAIPAGASLQRWQRLVFVPFVVAAVVMPLQLAALYRDFSRRNAPFMRMVDHLPKGARVLVVVHGMLHGRGAYESSDDVASSAPVYWNFSSWPMALNGGYDPYLTDETPIAPKVAIAAPSRSEIDLFDPREAPSFEYYLVRGQDDNMERQPSLKVIERYGEWVAFRRIYKMTDEP